ncbi:MAG: DNA-binding transcriptional LysR family regulator [Oceanospirillaceae bacterium]|jgi:DNA-binding transcriptional LysR family regulator
MNKLTAMTIFVQIVDSGSMTAAAKVLDTSLPTITRTLSHLEDYLKTRLFNRTTRKLMLTQEGMFYLQQCRQILHEIRATELELSSIQLKPSGIITLSAPVMFGNLHVMPLLEIFLQHNPQIKIELLLNDQQVNLVEDKIDVAIRIGHLADASYIAQNVAKVRRVICAAPKLLNSLGPILQPSDLLKVPCIRFTGLSHGQHWLLYEKGKTHAIAIQGPLVCNQIDTALQAVLSGMGLGVFLSYQVDAHLKKGDLVTVLDAFEPEEMPINVVYAHAQLLPKRVSVFVQWIKNALQKRLL